MPKPTQFDIVNHKLDTIITLLNELTGNEELFGDTEEYQSEMRSQTGEDLESFTRGYRPSETRTHVEVRSLDGDIDMVPWSEIDERIQEAVRIHKELAQRNPDQPLGPWQLYRDPTGMIRISVDQAVATELRKRHTYQQPVPQGGSIPRDMDVDEAARPKE